MIITLTIWKILLFIYVLINFFITGTLCGDPFHPDRKIEVFITALIFLLFGTLIHGCYWGYQLILKKPFKFINNNFGITTWFNIIFTKKYNNMDKEKLKDINESYQNSKDKDSFVYKMSGKCLKIINKKNNYKK